MSLILKYKNGSLLRESLTIEKLIIESIKLPIY